MRIFYLIIVIILVANSSLATDITFPWTTTIDCDTWTASPGNLDPSCDNFVMGGDWSADCGGEVYKYSQITSDANRSGGGGGKGFRYWVGDGTNVNSGNMYATFSNTGELWVRFYMRYGSGFAMTSGHKLFYPNNLYFSFEGVGATSYARAVFGGSEVTRGAEGKGFNWVNGGTTGDGEFHLYEFRVKYGASGGVTLWIDNEEIFNATGQDFSANSGTTFVRIPSNQAVITSGCTAIDIDDVAISTTGRIGPLVMGSMALTGGTGSMSLTGGNGSLTW